MEKARANNLLFNDIVKYMKHRWHHDGINKEDLITETTKKFNIAQGFVRAILRFIQTH